MSEVTAFLCVLALFGFLFVGGCCTGQAFTRDKAIQEGVAHWVVDPVTGITTFEFITPTKEPNGGQ